MNCREKFFKWIMTRMLVLLSYDLLISIIVGVCFVKECHYVTVEKSFVYTKAMVLPIVILYFLIHVKQRKSVLNNCVYSSICLYWVIIVTYCGVAIGILLPVSLIIRGYLLFVFFMFCGVMLVYRLSLHNSYADVKHWIIVLIFILFICSLPFRKSRLGIMAMLVFVLLLVLWMFIENWEEIETATEFYKNLSYSAVFSSYSILMGLYIVFLCPVLILLE